MRSRGSWKEKAFFKKGKDMGKMSEAARRGRGAWKRKTRRKGIDAAAAMARVYSQLPNVRPKRAIKVFFPANRSVFSSRRLLAMRIAQERRPGARLAMKMGRESERVCK